MRKKEMKNKIPLEELQAIYESKVKEYGLGNFKGIKVVSRNPEKLKDKLIYIAQNNNL